MSIVSRDQVLHLAKLAKLDLTSAEVDLYQRELATIIGFIDQLQKVDVEGIEPTEQVSRLSNVVRDDEVDEKLGLSLLDLEKNHQLEQGQFKVPRVNL